MLRAMILAAGRGTRLAPLTDGCAKPLVPVGDRPMLAHVLGKLRAAGIGRVVVNAHHRAEDIVDFATREADLVVSEERELLGTAGGVAGATDLLGEGDVLVWNGDIFAEPDLSALLGAHAALGGAATLAVAPRPPGKGSVGIDDRGRIVRLRADRVGEEVRGGEFIGIQVIGPRLRALLPAHGCLVGDVYIPALRRGAALQAFGYEGPFFDIGTLRRYLEANLDWLTASGASRAAGASGGRCWLGPGARVADGVVLEGSVVGAGAAIAGAGTLTRCVVWPGARAAAPLTDAIVMGEIVVGVRD